MLKSKKQQSAKTKAAKEVLQQLSNFVNKTDLTLSSESEEAVKQAKHGLGKLYGQLVDDSRRAFKAIMLAAIARSVFLPSDEVIDLYTKLRDNRESDDYRNYGKVVRKYAVKIAESYLPVNLHHNPYFRRAFRNAISNDDMKHGSSEAYNKKQRDIRTALAEIVKKDFQKMAFTRHDFEFLEDVDQIWPVIQYMASGKELAGTDQNEDFKELLKSLKDSGANVGEKGVAFHHLVWKKAFKGMFEESASLNPANLVAQNDTRGEKGDHDRMHTNSSYPKGHVQAEGGGKFRDMDVFIVQEMANVHLQPRKPKAEIYGAMAESLKDVAKKKRDEKKEEIGRNVTSFMRQ
jgi:hypothetical protein